MSFNDMDEPLGTCLKDTAAASPEEYPNTLQPAIVTSDEHPAPRHQRRHAPEAKLETAVLEERRKEDGAKSTRLRQE